MSEIPTESLAIVPQQSITCNNQLLGTADVSKLRDEREHHRYKQIWTKDAHGGPYKKVNASKGYDSLLQLPDGTDRQAELGYERAERGPTTNFVGNHMTQAAIDLVQAELQQPSSPSVLLLQDRPATDGPCLLSTNEKAYTAAILDCTLKEHSGAADLKKLRKSIRSARKDGNTTLATSTGSDTCNVDRIEAPPSTAPGQPTPTPETLATELQTATGFVNAGNWDQGLHMYNLCIAAAVDLQIIPICPLLGHRGRLAPMYLDRAKCHANLGNTEQAITDLGKAITHIDLDGDGCLAVYKRQALLLRAASYEQLERYSEAVQDVEVLLLGADRSDVGDLAGRLQRLRHSERQQQVLKQSQ